MIYPTLTLLRQWIQGFVELLIYFPVFLIAGIWLVDDKQLLLWFVSLPFYYLIGLSAQTVLRIKTRYVQFFVALAASIVLTFFVASNTVELAFGWGVGILLCYRGMQMKLVSWNVLFPIPFYWVGLLIYFFAHFIFKYNASLSGYLPYVTWAGVGSLIICLFLTNRTQLKAEALPGQKEPVLSAAMVRHNRFLMTGLVILIFAVGAFNQIKNALASLFKGLIQYILSLFSGDEGQTVPIEESPPPPTMPALEGKEPALWLAILEKIMFYAVMIIIAVALLVLAYFVLVKLARQLYKLAQWLKRYLGSHSDHGGALKGFVDEESHLLSWKEVPKAYAERFKDWLSTMLEREVKWEQLQDNRQRARYLYRHLLLHLIAAGYPFKHYLTPKETGAEIANWDDKKTSRSPEQMREFVAVYNQARYADEAPDDAQLEKMKKLNETLK